MTDTSPPRTCPICGRSLSMNRPDQEYCSFTCAGKAGTTSEQILARSLAKLGEQAREEQRAAHAFSTRPTKFAAAPPVVVQLPGEPDGSAPAIIQPFLPDAEDEPPAAQSAVVLYDGDITKDSTAYRDSGTRNELLASRLLGKTGDTIAITGYGAGLRVERDALVVTEGHTHYPDSPRVHKLYRGLHAVERIICLNPTGSLSFSAAAWCREQGITVVLLGLDGGLLSTLTPNEAADAQLRRSQYLAHERGTDLAIVKELLRRKFQAQLDTINVMYAEFLDAPRAGEALQMAIKWFELQPPPPWLESIDMLRTYEGRTAAQYFGAWRSFRVRWAKQDRNRIPPHWLGYDGRSSPLTARSLPRKAVDPINACLNFSYAVLESQVRQALNAQGFDVACGFLHMDLKGRDSLVYDLMEPFRGTVDSLVLRFLSAHTLHYGDMTRVHDGSCRLHPQLARAVVAACKLPQEPIHAAAVWLRDTLLHERGESNG
ncbi:MAG: CRISPR-associated endonuclease Cas1 [Ktedonobacterales bacterium]